MPQLLGSPSSSMTPSLWLAPPSFWVLPLPERSLSTPGDLFCFLCWLRNVSESTFQSPPIPPPYVWVVCFFATHLMEFLWSLCILFLLMYHFLALYSSITLEIDDQEAFLGGVSFGVRGELLHMRRNAVTGTAVLSTGGQLVVGDSLGQESAVGTIRSMGSVRARRGLPMDGALSDIGFSFDEEGHSGLFSTFTGMWAMRERSFCLIPHCVDMHMCHLYILPLSLLNRSAHHAQRDNNASSEYGQQRRACYSAHSN